MPQEPAEALFAVDLGLGCRPTIAPVDDFVAQALVWPLEVVVADEFTEDALKVVASEEDDPIETLRFRRQYPAFGDRVHVGRSIGGAHGRDAGVFEDALELRREQVVVVEDEVSLVAEESVEAVGQVAGDLGHER